MRRMYRLSDSESFDLAAVVTLKVHYDSGCDDYYGMPLLPPQWDVQATTVDGGRRRVAGPFKTKEEATAHLVEWEARVEGALTRG